MIALKINIHAKKKGFGYEINKNLL